MVHVARDKKGIAGLDRILLAVAKQGPRPLNHKNFVLPGVNVMAASLTGQNVGVAQGTGGRIVVQGDQPGCRAAGSVVISVIPD